MKGDGENLIYLGAGPLAAVLLGMALIPVRGLTTASNLTFVFIALVILVAELGGRGAAVATALSSSLSLDFFLTRPYLRLSIEEKHDVIAFLGLTACGLVAAAVGSHRSERVAALRASRAQQELVRHALEQLEMGAPREVGLSRVLDASRGVLPLAEAAVHDTSGNLLAATGQARGRPMPERHLDAPGALPIPSRRAEALPREGMRIPLVTRGRAVGWLDAWGDGSPGRPGAREAFTDVARLLALILGGPERGLPAAAPGLPESSSPG